MTFPVAHPCQHLLFSAFWILSILIGAQWRVTTDDIMWSIFSEAHLSFCTFSLVKYLLLSLFYKLDCLFSYCCVFIVLFILDNSFLSAMSFGNRYSSQAMSCFFHSVTLSFAEQKFLILMKSSLLIFFMYFFFFFFFQFFI